MANSIRVGLIVIRERAFRAWIFSALLAVFLLSVACTLRRSVGGKAVHAITVIENGQPPILYSAIGPEVDSGTTGKDRGEKVRAVPDELQLAEGIAVQMTRNVSLDRTKYFEVDDVPSFVDKKKGYVAVVILEGRAQGRSGWISCARLRTNDLLYFPILLYR